MSRHYTKSERDFEIEFRPSQQATAHGGQMAIAGLAREYGLWKKLENYPALDPRTDKRKGFGVSLYVAAFVFGFCSGAKSGGSQQAAMPRKARADGEPCGAI